jgi:hypothetical protein
LKNLYQFDETFLKYVLQSKNISLFNDLNYNNFMLKSQLTYKIDHNLIDFFNEYSQVLLNPKIKSKYLLDLLYNLYDLDLNHKQNLINLKDEFHNK